MKRIYLLVMILLVFTLSGCGEKKSPSKTSKPTEKEIAIVHEETTFTGVIIDINFDDGYLIFRDCISGEDTKLDYHGGVGIQNTYDKELTSDSLLLGKVYDVTYYTDTGRLVNIKENASAKRVPSVVKFSADKENNKAKYKGTTCKMSEHVIAFDGDTAIDVSEINTEDQITLQFFGDKLVSATVELGHGYVRLVNQDTYIGGMVEIGHDVIVPVTSDMLLAVREGSYTLRINKGSYNDSKRVDVIRDRESRVDISDLAIPSGVVNFIVTPEDAEPVLYVNDVEQAGLLFIGTYGSSYSFVIKAEGYKDYKGSIRIANASRDYEVNLSGSGSKTDSGKDEDASSATVSTTEQGSGDTTGTGTGSSTEESDKTTVGDGTNETSQSESATEEASSGDTTGSSTTEGTTSATTEAQATNNKVTIKEPVGVSVYVDGDYVGIAPVSFPKTVGTHTITLYQRGYLIKSYTIQSADNGKDDEYKYAPLVPLTGTTE